MIAGGELDEAFARHVVDDIVLPLLAGSVMQPGAAANTTATGQEAARWANTTPRRARLPTALPSRYP